MSNYIIISDSTTDLSKKMIDDLGIGIVPFKFIIEGNTYENLPDESSMSNKEFYKKLRSGSMSTTTQVNSTEFTDMFEKYLSEGLDILYIGFSSGLSGTYQASTIAKEELLKKYPDRKIELFDTKAASMGQGLLVYLACGKKSDGCSMDEVLDFLKNNYLKLCHWFTVDDLHHLKRGGRVSAAAAAVGTVLGIKPVLHMDDEGHLIPRSKIRGRKQSLDSLIKKMEEVVINPKNQTVFISHGDCIDDAEYVASQVKKKFSPKEIVVNFIGPVIGAHSGPGTVALFFLGSER